MLASSILGAAGAALAALQPAVPPVSPTHTIQWTGPFEPGEAMFPGPNHWVPVRHGQALTLTTSVVAQLADSDIDWWLVTG